MREIVVFSGSAHRSLAQAICAELGVELSSVEMTRFSNDCLQAQLQANCRQRDVYIVQPLVPPTQEHLMELLLMIDAARGASAAQITAVIPHYAYARSDKKDASRISIGGPAGRRHAHHGRRRPGADDDAARPAGARVLLRAGRPPHRARACSPTTSSAGTSPTPWSSRPTSATPRRRPSSPGCSGCRWRRAASAGWPTTAVVIDAIVGDVAGKRAIVLDDEIATGGSIVELLDRLADEGCTSAAVACTHGLFVGKAVDRLRQHPMITEVVTTDTVPAPAGLARAPGALGGRPVRRGDRPRSTPASRSAASSTGSTPRSGRPSRGCSTSAPAPGRGAPPGDPGRARR